MTLNLTNLLASQVTGYEAYNSQFNIDNLKKINYVTAANGLFRVEKTPVALFKNKIQEYKKPIPGLDVMTEGVELLIPKIPFKFLQMALSFYLDVYDKDKTEASLLFFWNTNNVRLPSQYSDKSPVKGLMTEGQFVVYVPRQKNSSGLSEFHMDPTVDWLRTNLSLLCETHSHHTMNAFFSGTDDANENATQFYGVWGKIKDQQPAFAFRYVSGESKVKISPDILFDWPMVTTTTTSVVTSEIEGFEPQRYVEQQHHIYKGPFAKLDYPAEWMEQHTARAEVKVKSTYPSSAFQRNFISGRDGRLSRFDWDMEEQIDAFDPNYVGDFGNYELDIPTLPSMASFEDADVVQFMDLEDEKNKFDIRDNIADITAEYAKLGYGQVIESAIDGVKQNAI